MSSECAQGLDALGLGRFTERERELVTDTGRRIVDGDVECRDQGCGRRTAGGSKERFAESDGMDADAFVDIHDGAEHGSRVEGVLSVKGVQGVQTTEGRRRFGVELLQGGDGDGGRLPFEQEPRGCFAMPRVGMLEGLDQFESVGLAELRG